jgi:C4-type Zn-finger protein
MNKVDVRTFDFYQVFVVTDEVEKIVQCPVCGSELVEIQQGDSSAIAPMFGPLHLVVMYTCDGCDREIIACHEDLADALQKNDHV